MKFSTGLLCACLGVALVGRVSAAGAADLGLFEPLWSRSLAASDTVILPHPAYRLVRVGDRVRATLLGDYGPNFKLPEGSVEVLRHGPYLEVWANRTALTALAENPSTQAVYPPLLFRPTVVSEARAGMGVARFDTHGEAGAGVRVAVVDLDFTGWQNLRGVELPADTYFKSFLNSGSAGSFSAHGTAVAEIIHDIAPAAQLYLLQIAETSDFVQAVDWCIDNGMNVANMSLAFVASSRDGSGYHCEQVNRAAEAGVIWVSSAGNEAATHWQGAWQDANGNGVLDLAAGREVVGFTYSGTPGGFPLLLTQLVWNRWPSTSGLSFDIEIYRDSLRNILLANSNGYPSLSLAHRLAVQDNPAVGRYYVSVVHRFGSIPPGLHFDLFLDNNYAHQMSPVDPLGSLVSPADATGAVAVGAYDYAVSAVGATPTRPYSSCGPTWDGRLKPDLSAGDGVSTDTYGSHGFFGTSASSPHVAGAAAVLSGATVSGGLFTYVWSTADFLRLLEANSIDFGSPGFDNVYGRGGAVLPPASSEPLALSVRSSPNPFNQQVELSFPMAPGTSFRVRVFDVLGRLVYSTDGLHTHGERARVTWCGCGFGGEELPSGVYFYRVDTDYETGQGRAVLLR